MEAQSGVGVSAQYAKARGLILFIFAMATLSAGCSQNQSAKVNSPALNGQDCTGNAVATNFLIKWKEKVPSELNAFKLSPDSLITRLSNTTKETVEKEVLQKHRGEFEFAEHEFYSESVESEPGTRDSGVVTPLASPAPWGPVDARAAEAWTAGSSKGAGVVVAVIDSGMDIKHPLLKSQLWVNPGETSGNGKDDDGNGLPDDTYGWNFGDSNSDLTDYVSRGGHGTHVAGIIAGQTVDGFTGMAPEAKLMVLKFIDGSGRGLLGDAVAAITYARRNGAKVINASWGGSQCQDSLKLEITAAVTSGVFVAVAAGNGDASGHGVDINLQPEWPANYIIPGKLTIAAHNIDQTLAIFSNYGVLVDLAAPGENIFSTLQTPAGQVEAGLMGAKSGTSMATPMVAGAAALLYSVKPGASALQVSNALTSTVTLGGGFGVRTHGKLNAEASVNYILSH